MRLPPFICSMFTTLHHCWWTTLAVCTVISSVSRSSKLGGKTKIIYSKIPEPKSLRNLRKWLDVHRIYRILGTSKLSMRSMLSMLSSTSPRSSFRCSVKVASGAGHGRGQVGQVLIFRTLVAFLCRAPIAKPNSFRAAAMTASWS